MDRTDNNLINTGHGFPCVHIYGHPRVNYLFKFHTQSKYMYITFRFIFTILSLRTLCLKYLCVCDSPEAAQRCIGANCSRRSTRETVRPTTDR